MSIREVTVVIVNFETPALTRACVQGLLDAYPQVPLTIVDNGSRDESAVYVRALAEERANVTAILNRKNRHHGPALDQGVRSASTRYAFTLDSDCEIRQSGFLEHALDLFSDLRTYAVGELRYKSRYGFTFGYEPDALHGRRERIPYVHPWAMLLDREKYLRLSPFIDHGAPAIKNMRDARRAGYAVHDFPMSDFITHLQSGTLGRHGWGFRARLKVVRDHALNRLEGAVFAEPTVDRLSKRRRHSAG